MNNSVNIISKVLQCVPKLEYVGKAIETINSIQKKASKYKEKINENESDLLTTFFKELEQKKGSIHEFDAISEFIYESFANCNNGTEEEKYKENVLIIDDLDRIDPEHIFRLLNVFSAHIDSDNNTNKFGFDKIIFVCDVKNIRNIFAAKYGQYADFSGYIDKFYSSEIFTFDNKTAIFEFVKQIMDDNLTKCNRNLTNFNPAEVDSIKDILYLLTENRAINLRQILANAKELKNKKQNVGQIGRYTYSIGYVVIHTCLRILGGQIDTLIDALKKVTIPLDQYHFNMNAIASDILPLWIDDVFYYQIDDIISKNGVSHFSYNDNIKVEFNLNKVGRGRSACVVADLISPTTIDWNTLQVIFIEVIKKLDKKGLLY